jgi:hypothetical protein
VERLVLAYQEAQHRVRDSQAPTLATTAAVAAVARRALVLLERH